MKYLIVRFSAKLLITAAALVGVVGVDAASAAFPGENGKIAYVQPANGELTGYIYSYPGFGQPAGPGDYNADPAWSPDGQTVAFARDLAFGDQSFDIFVPGCCGDEDFGLAQGREPAWSPDGQKIAYASPFPPTEIHSMNVDGSANVNLTQSPGNDDQPNWSPDGQKIAFTSFRDGVPRIYVMNADGTAQTPLSGAGFGDRDPNWSPDGQRIAFAREMSGDTEIAVMNADGSGVTVLTDNNVDDREPAWSPDGTKIAYQFGDFGTSIWSMNTDGTGQTSLISGTDPDWQPVLRGYARPKGARPFHAALAIAYRECMSPNREHGAPLVTPSCSPPQQASDHLTVGTLDANSQAAKFTGYVRYDPKPGNEGTPADEADLRLEATMKDVRMSGSLADYPGEVAPTVSIRITDRDNTPYPGGPGPGTAQDLTLAYSVPCTTTPSDATIGSSCALVTTLEAFLPNAVKEGRRSNWGLGQAKVFDGGADGDADTTTDNTLFATEGLFAP